MTDPPNRLLGNDFALIIGFCLLLFGFSAVSGRPLTMHEARLPETSREMAANHQWLLPSSGGRPWLERPPLPHWVVISAMKLTGRRDAVWVVRLPSMVMGTITVLLTAWMAARLIGRDAGLLSALVLATAFEFFSYSSLAEDDIYLAAISAAAAACFVKAELLSAHRRLRWWSIFSGRGAAIVGFFFLFGLTNLTKGPVLGMAILGPPIAVFLLSQRSVQSLLRWGWAWGILLSLLMAAAWPAWAVHRVPDVVDNWKYDYLGRLNNGYLAEPWWYYVVIFSALAPWTPFCLVGLVSVFRTTDLPQRRGDTEKREEFISGNILDYQPIVSPPHSSLRLCVSAVKSVLDPANAAGRFTVCWALIPLLVLSIPAGKHHHYLVPFLAPWAILGASGLLWCGRRIRWSRGTGAGIATAAAVVLLLGYNAAMSVFAARSDHTVDDTAFLIRARGESADRLLFINAKLGPVGNLDFFRTQFYSRADARLLHNLTYLRDEQITAPMVYVITRQKDQPTLQKFGSVEVVDQSRQSHEDGGKPAGRFTLFRLTYDPKLRRYPAPPRPSSLQAMERGEISGPWCGPAE